MAKENLTTYTEVDPNNHLSQTADRATFANLNRDEAAYLYKDKGVDHFDGDFEHLIDVYLDAGYMGLVGLWGLSNTLTDGRSQESENSLLLRFYKSNGTIYLQLGEYPEKAEDQWSGASLDTTYYLRIKRDESVGTYGTLYCDVYTSNADRANEINAVANLSISLHAKRDFRYILTTFSYDDVYADRQMTGYVENLDLQEVPPAVGRSFGYIFSKIYEHTKDLASRIFRIPPLVNPNNLAPG